MVSVGSVVLAMANITAAGILLLKHPFIPLVVILLF